MNDQSDWWNRTKINQLYDMAALLEVPITAVHQLAQDHTGYLLDIRPRNVGS